MDEGNIKGMDRARKGLVMLIQGLIEDTEEFLNRYEKGDDGSMRLFLNGRVLEIDTYLVKAETVHYEVLRRDLEEVKIRYGKLKRKRDELNENHLSNKI
jgi:hypothetical protein